MVTVRGSFRVYFNRHQAAPLVWCVALVDTVGKPAWEIAVRSVVFHAVNVSTLYTAPLASDDETGLPSAVLKCTGVLDVNTDGVAVLTATPR